MCRFKLMLMRILSVATIIAVISPAYVFAAENLIIEEGLEPAGDLEDDPAPEIKDPEEIEESEESDEPDDRKDEPETENTEEPPRDKPKKDKEKDTDKKSDAGKDVEVALYPASERVIYKSTKCSLDKAFEMLPRTWAVIFPGGEEQETVVAWECKDDFDNDRQSSFVFQGYVCDEGISQRISDKMAKRMTMEILFEDQLWDIADHDGNPNEMPLWEQILSPHSIIPDISKEQGVDEYDKGFLDDYGSNADSVIKVDKSFKGKHVVLSDETADVFRNISPSKQNVYYSSLSSEEKKFYDKIDSCVTQYLYYGKEPLYLQPYTVTEYLSYGDLTRTKAMEVFNIYYWNNPQAFFLTSAYMNYSNKLAISFLPDSNTPKEIKNRAEIIADNLRAVSDKVNEQKGEFKRAKEAQKLLCDRVSYDWDAFESKGQHPWSKWTEGDLSYCQSIMSVFSGKRHKTVCAGYSQAYTALLRLSGIEGFGVAGGDHEWNKVFLYGKWYCADPTYDDLYARKKPCGFDYFLKSDATLEKIDGRVWFSYIEDKVPESGSDFKTSQKLYKITYKLGGGTNHRMNPAKYTANAGKIKLYSPARKGYRFAGWYDNKDYEGEKIAYIDASEKENITLYAKWKKKG